MQLFFYKLRDLFFLQAPFFWSDVDVDVDGDVDVNIDVDVDVDVDIDVAAKKEWNIKMPASGVEMGANYLSGASGTGICKYSNQQ